jgi:CO dehydrogenase nickel-insertion accessory protein CooC1
MLFASKVHGKVRELIKELENNVLFIINKFSEILNKLSTSPRWTKRSGNLLKLLNRVESFFRILVS